MIVYQVGTDGVDEARLDGFFDGWASSPSPAGLLRILRNSSFAVVALDGDDVVGFVNALSDGELAVYIPLLEVRATHRGRGIGSELVRRVMRAFDGCYMIDVVCDEHVAPFYERLGMARLVGMAHRNRSATIFDGSR